MPFRSKLAAGVHSYARFIRVCSRAPVRFEDAVERGGVAPLDKRGAHFLRGWEAHERGGLPWKLTLGYVLGFRGPEAVSQVGIRMRSTCDRAMGAR